jgi:pimeloyl-ACP methyl ester carboxylesterase
VAIADHFGIERFSVLGYSGGGTYALACAQKIPERLGTVILVSSTGPHDVGGLTDDINSNSLQFMQLCANRPVLGALASRSMGFMARWFPGRLIAGEVSSLPEPDARLMSDPEIGLKFARLVSEAARNGGRAKGMARGPDRRNLPGVSRLGRRATSHLNQRRVLGGCRCISSTPRR